MRRYYCYDLVEIIDKVRKQSLIIIDIVGN